jgi:hypothetical protein
MKPFFLIVCFGLGLFNLTAQCNFAINEIDDFDSTHSIVTKPINIGYSIPSNFQTADGYKMIEEAKAIFSFTQNDTLNAFFMVIGLVEREFLTLEEGFNVILKVESLKDTVDLGKEVPKPDPGDVAAGSDLIGLYTVPDRGTFDKNTNMRIYTLTCLIPLDRMFTLSYASIERIRINYKTSKHTITLSNEQRAAIKKAVLCVGEEMKLFPSKP